MGKIKLREAIKGKKTIIVERRPALYAIKCDCCGLVFQMKEYCNDRDLGELKGTFDSGATDHEGRHLGNIFMANVCSFKCADDIMKGGWKNIKEYRPYIKSKANLVRCELKITSYVLGEKELVENWEGVK